MSLFPEIYKLPIHPFLISSFTGFVLYVSNIALIPIESTYNAFALIALSCLSLLSILWAIFKNLQKAAVLCSLLFVLLFSYSDLYNFANLPIAGISVQRQGIIFPVFTAMLVSACWFIIKLKPAAISAIHSILNISSFVVFIFQVLQLWNHQNIPVILPQATGLETQPIVAGDGTAAVYPDIVYLILDGYGRQDVLKKYYNFDNSQFIEFLKDQGFYIANNSSSNYCHTILSLTSSLNLNYIQSLMTVEQKANLSRQDLSHLLKNANLFSFLKKYHYQIKSFSSGYSLIDMDSNSEVLSPRNVSLEFCYLLLNKTPFIIITQNQFLSQLYLQIIGTFIKQIDPYQKHQDRILFTLNNLPTSFDTENPSFIFADIFAAHPPFVFSANGERISPQRPYSLEFIIKGKESRDEYKKGYVNQVSYINKG